MGNADSKLVGADADENLVMQTVMSKSLSSQGSGGGGGGGYNDVDNDGRIRTRTKKSTTKAMNGLNGAQNPNERLESVNNGVGPIDPITNRVIQCRDDEEEDGDKDGGGYLINGKITDDQINVNLAMADLMAYLQVVANNSNQLPLTRRDDPELDRTLSTLTPEDYARKSAAFIPADVRVIGGSFTRYGRVWDLPTSEEYNACDGAHEPGRSYGGACSNSLLKVVYDAVNEAVSAEQAQVDSSALFEDDDDEEESTFGKSIRSGFSLEAGNPNPSTITWAHMFRQMKAEFKDVGYAQLPRITTTRKIDLNQAFSLVSDDFDPLLSSKRSLLIGCNYSGVEGAELKASHDDVRSMKDYIVNVHGFSEREGMMTVLLDDDDHLPPTFMNIIEAFKAISEVSQPGDAVFIQFTGHGGRVLDSANDSEAESYDETICPLDYKTAGLIRDTLIFKTLLAPMRFGVTVTIMIDCCDNGMVLELPYSWTPRSEKRDKDTHAKLSTNDDFSYVRFLKVVKTLYESSTFTQLGRTVKSALPGSVPEKPKKASKDYQSKTQAVDRGRGRGESDVTVVTDADLGQGGSQSILDAIADACSPAVKEDEVLRSKDNNPLCFNDSPGQSQQQMSRLKESLLEKVMNCTLLGPPEEDFSDDDTFKTRTEEDQSFDDGYTENEDSFDSMAEETNEYRKSKSRKHKRRS